MGGGRNGFSLVSLVVVVGLATCRALSEHRGFDTSFRLRRELPGLRLPAGCAPFPLPPNNVCAGSGWNNPNGNLTESCGLLGAVEEAIIGSNPGGSCYAVEQAPAPTTSLSGQALPYPLADARPLPATISAPNMEQEGASLYWLYKVLYNFRLWVHCAATNTTQTSTPGIPTTGDPTKDFLVPPGWTPYSTLWVPDGKDAEGIFLPFAAVLTKGQEVLVLIRGSSFVEDWLLDFNYALTSPSPLPLPGTIHTGFHSLAVIIWPGLKAALQALWARSGGISHVYVSGSSLGAGVGSLLSYAAQTYLDELYAADCRNSVKNGGCSYATTSGVTTRHSQQSESDDSTATADGIPRTTAKTAGGGRHSHHTHTNTRKRKRHNVPNKHDYVVAPRVDAALFAAPVSGDATFTSSFGKRVNARLPAFQSDMVPQVPCSPMIDCQAFVPVPTLSPNGEFWPYGVLPGHVSLQATGMPVNKADWVLFDAVYLCQLGRFFAATHSCSYMCFFSGYVQDGYNQCRLRNDTASQGTYCPTYPSDDGYPFEP